MPPNEWLGQNLFWQNENTLLFFGETVEVIDLNNVTTKTISNYPSSEYNYGIVRVDDDLFLTAGGNTWSGMAIGNSRFASLFDLGISFIEESVTEKETVLETITLISFPNPFNNQITLCYTLDNTSEITIELYDIKGEKITTLFSGDKTKGEHTLKVNFSHYGLSSGVYFTRLSTQRGSYSTKLLLTK